MATVYLAGPMARSADRGEQVAWWRKEIMKSVPELRWYVPEIAGCDHGGLVLEAIYENALDLVRLSDAVVAVIDDFDRAGTITEIGMAHALGKPVMVVVNKFAHRVPYDAFYDVVTRTPHGCTCMTDGKSGRLWFPLQGAREWAEYEDENDIPPLAVHLIRRWLLGVSGRYGNSDPVELEALSNG